MLTGIEQTVSHQLRPPCAGKPGRLSQGADPDVLADIYRTDMNLVVWQRSLSLRLEAEVTALVATNPNLMASLTVSPDSAHDGIGTAMKVARHSPLCDDLAELVDMFCCLFDHKRVGLRVAVLDKAMCPRFHVDNVPCRLLSTYSGSATEWLPNEWVDRTKLGRGSAGKPDHESGLYPREASVQRLNTGDVALLKGESWAGNEGFGLVHRSPAVAAGERRLVVTIDMI